MPDNDILTRIERKIDKQDDKLDKQDIRLDSIDLKWERNNTLLDYHIKRTDILEEKLAPVIRDHDRVKFVAKIVAAVIGSAGVVGSVVEVIRHWIIP